MRATKRGGLALFGVYDEPLSLLPCCTRFGVTVERRYAWHTQLRFESCGLGFRVLGTQGWAGLSC